jgi:Putative transposase, YhgA-like
VAGGEAHTHGMFEVDETHPHDKFFRGFFSEGKRALALVELALRERFPSGVEWFDPELVPSEFLSEVWSEGRSDLIIKIRARAPQSVSMGPLSQASMEITVFIVGEHQTTQPRDVMLRFLGYLVEMLRAAQRQAEAERRAAMADGSGTETAGLAPPALPVVLFVILHQSVRPWVGARSFSDLVETPDWWPGLRELLPDFRPLIVDLAAVSEAEIDNYVRDHAARLALSLMKTIPTQKVRAWLDRRGPELLEAGQAPGGTALLEDFMKYLMVTENDLPPREFSSEIVKQLAKRTDSATMTLAQAFRQEGRQEGRRELIATLLEERFPSHDWAAAVNGVEVGSLSALGRQVLHFQTATEALRWITEHTLVQTGTQASGE